MAMERIPVRKIKETLRLRHACKLSQREVAGAVRVAPSTVSDYLKRAKTAGLSWPLPEGLDDDALERLLFVQSEHPAGEVIPVPDWRKVRAELSGQGVTRQLVWQEYIDEHADGYSYSRFCELYREWAKHLKPTMRFDHKAGERAYIDYPGLTMSYIDPETREVRAASLFVAVLAASDYTYCEAVRGEDLVSWIGGHERAFQDWDGVPAIVVPDNLKAGVTSPCRYEPDVNPTYHEFAVHYGVAVIPARVRKPRDKSKAEAGVQVVERWVMAPLRNELFVGLAALNEAIRKRREALNDRVMIHLGKSRRQLFEEIDRPALKPLPAKPFEMGTWQTVRVAIDYHVRFDWHYYSVPHALIHQEVDVRATRRVVEVFHKSVRVASHLRSEVRGGHTTLPEHMPESHRKYLEWTPEHAVKCAQNVGPLTTQLVEAMMAAAEHPEQGLRSSQGILSLARRYPHERLESAAQRALHYGLLSYKGVRNILESGLDSVAIEQEPSPSPAPPHENVRGAEYYEE